MPLPGVAFQRVGLGARLPGDLLSLGTGVREQLVGLAPGVGDMVVGGALGHHQDAQGLLLPVTGNDRTGTLGTHLLQFGLHRAGRLLGGGLVPVEPVKLGLELGVLLG